MKKKRLFLHIGTDKTGSTAIQNFLQNNESVLLSQGLKIIAAGRLNDHHGELFNQLKQENENLIYTLAEEINNSQLSNFIISHEGLYHINEKIIIKLYKTLGNIEIIPILYLRRRSDKLASGMAQRLKKPECKDDIRLYNDNYQVFYKQAGLNYKSIVQKWENAINYQNPNELMVKIYERSEFYKADITHDFLKTITNYLINTQLDISTLRFEKNEVNKSIGPSAQYILSILRSVDLEKEKINFAHKILNNHQSEKERRCTFIPDTFLDQFDKHFLDDDQWIAKRYLNKNILFSEPRKFYYHKPTSDELHRLFKLLFKRTDSFKALSK